MRKQFIMMKHTVLVLIATFFAVVSFATDSFYYVENDSQGIELEKEPVKNTGDDTKTRPRSLYMVDAYYYPSAQILELVHDGLGETDIYLVDSYGTVVHQSHFVSSIYSAEQIIVPDIPGIYTVIIDSDAVYARGVFSIN